MLENPRMDQKGTLGCSEVACYEYLSESYGIFRVHSHVVASVQWDMSG